jgi:hypothetical protein
MRLPIPLAMLVVAAACLACVGPDQLLFTTYTKVGLDISLTDGQPTEAVFGYKRFEGAIVPVDPDAEEAQSLYAGLCIDNGWLSGLTIGQVFATGEAAVRAASNPAAGTALAGALVCDEPSGNLAGPSGGQQESQGQQGQEGQQ